MKLAYVIGRGDLLGSALRQVTFPIFERLARSHPRIGVSGTMPTTLYPRRIHFRSIVPHLRSRPRTSLMVGASRILAAERLRQATSAASPS